MQGWIKLYRKLLDNPIANNPNYGWTFVVLLLKANHQDNEFLHGNTIIKVKRGQLVTGRKSLAREIGINENTLQVVLKKLEDLQIIQQQTNSRYRLITIVNYDYYQEDQQQNNSKITANQQQNNTNKNDNNVKNEKNIYMSDSEATESDLSNQNKEKETSYKRFCDFFNSIRKKYLKDSKGVGYTDDKAKRQYLALVKKKVTKEDLERAIENAFADKHHRETSWRYVTPEFITRPSIYERFQAIKSTAKNEKYNEKEEQDQFNNLII